MYEQTLFEFSPRSFPPSHFFFFECFGNAVHGQISYAHSYSTGICNLDHNVEQFVWKQCNNRYSMQYNSFFFRSCRRRRRERCFVRNGKHFTPNGGGNDRRNETGDNYPDRIRLFSSMFHSLEKIEISSNLN